MHQPGDEVGLLGVLVVVAALDEAARAVADADDRDADLAVLAAARAGPRVAGRRAVAAVLRSCSLVLLLPVLVHDVEDSLDDGDGREDRDESEAGRERQRPGRPRLRDRPPATPVQISPIVRMTSRTSRGARPTLAMPVPGGEAEALGLGARVADHERRGHGRRGEDAPSVEAGGQRSRRRCRRRRSPRRRGRRSSRGTRRTSRRGRSRGRACRRTGRRSRTRGRGCRRAASAGRRRRRRDARAEEADDGQGVRREAEAADARARSGVARSRTRSRRPGETNEPVTTRRSAPRRLGRPRTRARARRTRRRPPGGAGRPSRGRPAGSRRGRRRGAGRGATTRAAGDRPTCVDELGDRRLGLGEPLDDPQPVHVSEGLVDEAAARAARRAGRRRTRWCCGRGQVRGTGGPPFGASAVASTTVYINLR